MPATHRGQSQAPGGAWVGNRVVTYTGRAELQVESPIVWEEPGQTVSLRPARGRGSLRGDPRPHDAKGMRGEGLKRGKEETFVTAERGGDKPCDGAARLVRQHREQRGRWLVIKPAHILRLEGQR